MHTRSRRLLGIVAIVSALTMVGTGTALATGTLDQSNPGPADASTAFGFDLAQTFTAGMTGALDTVQLNVWRIGSAPDLTVQIEGTNNLANPGLPDDSDVLATQVVPEADVPTTEGNVQTVVFDIPAQVQAGTEYAIVLRFGSSNQYVWGMTSSGGAMICAPLDTSWLCDIPFLLIFATYVTPPVTADVAVAITGPASVRSGSTNTFQVTVSNAGPMSAENVVLTVPVPAGTKFVSAIPTQGTCSAPARRAAPPTITCTLGDLSAAGSTLTTVTLKVSLNAKGGGIVTVAQAYSTATNATPATTDPDLSNNVASVSSTVTK